MCLFLKTEVVEYSGTVVPPPTTVPENFCSSEKKVFGRGAMHLLEEGVLCDCYRKETYILQFLFA
jgi:hypothetical protein